MSPKIFKQPGATGLSLAFAIALISLFLAPITQIAINGSVAYINGEDEYSYLNYWFAKKTFSFTRITSALVLTGHNFGLNGGQINLVLDTFSVLAIVFMAYIIVKKATPEFTKILFCLVLMLAFPLLLGTSNPVHSKIIDLINRFDATAYYIVFNHSMFPAILRSPESQLSIAAVFLMTLAMIYSKRGWLFLLLIPMTYYFVGIYYFSVVSVYFALNYASRNLGWLSRTKISLTCCVVFVGLSLGVWIPTYLFVNKLHVISHHAPVIGLSLIYMSLLVAILVYVYDWQTLSKAHQRLVISIIAGAFMVYNFQVINGSILQPQHFEIDGPIACSALISIFYLFAQPRNINRARLTENLLVILMISGAMIYGYKSVKLNLAMHQRIEKLLLDPEFNLSVSVAPEKVFVTDPVLSSQISGLVLVKSQPLLSSIEPAFIGDSNYHKNLIQLRRYFEEHPTGDNVYDKALTYLIDRHEDEFLNWQRFAVLRRGILSTENKSADSTKEVDPLNIKLFKVNN